MKPAQVISLFNKNSVVCYHLHTCAVLTHTSNTLSFPGSVVSPLGDNLVNAGLSFPLLLVSHSSLPVSPAHPRGEAKARGMGEQMTEEERKDREL